MCECETCHIHEVWVRKGHSSPSSVSPLVGTVYINCNTHVHHHELELNEADWWYIISYMRYCRNETIHRSHRCYSVTPPSIWRVHWHRHHESKYVRRKHARAIGGTMGHPVCLKSGDPLRRPVLGGCGPEQGWMWCRAWWSSYNEKMLNISSRRRIWVGTYYGIQYESHYIDAGFYIRQQPNQGQSGGDSIQKPKLRQDSARRVYWGWAKIGTKCHPSDSKDNGGCQGRER